VKGNNTYAAAGIYPLTVTILKAGVTMAVVTGAQAVADASLSGIGVNLNATAGMAVTNVVAATFTDPNQATPLNAYTASIDWGDGNTSDGSIVPIKAGTYAVLGSNTYASGGTYQVGVSVSDSGGSGVLAASTVSVSTSPVVTAVGPNFGAPSGGTAVTIYGNNLAGATQVNFGGTAATAFQVNADGSITAVSPAAAAGTLDITVVTSVGTSPVSAADQFSYEVVPAVTGLNISSGPTGGSNAITITGTNLAGASRVLFGNVAASFTINSATSITAIAPAELPGTVDITVATPFGVSPAVAADQYTFTAAAPTVAGLDLQSGPAGGGSTITVSGTNFNGATAVSFGGSPAAFTVLDSTDILVTAPAHAAGTVDIIVTTPYGSSPVSSADQFTFVAAPSVTGVLPAAGPTGGGNTVTLTGAGFTGATQVSFGTLPAPSFTVLSDSSIQVTAPASVAGTFDITVTTPGGTSPTGMTDQYTFQATPPAVTAIAPNRGPTAGGTAVTITGANFNGATQVWFGATAVPSFSVLSSTQITAVAPALPAGPAVDVTVVTPYGTSATSAADQYTAVDASAPTVAGLSVTSGPMAGGTAVTITGTGFTAGTAVLFGTAPGTAYTVLSDTQIQATAPAQAAGTIDVTVTTPYGVSGITPADQYTYVAAVPTVTGVSPSADTTAGGTTITITGSNFSNATQVWFGSVASPSFTINSDNSLSVLDPAQAAGTVDITVVNPAGTSALGAGDRFTYSAAPNIPAVTGLSATSGPTGGGTTITISGSHFTGATAVTFAGALATAFTVLSDTAISAVVPAQSAGMVDVQVATAAGISAIAQPADQYTFVATAPAITAVSPASGTILGGDTVLISGSNLSGTTQVTFGGTSAVFAVLSPTQIQATTPARSAGQVDIVVTTPYGSSPTGAADKFTFQVIAGPVVTGLSPAAGPNSGGNSLTITGSHFTGTAAVNFGLTAAVSFQVISDTQIVAISPAEPVGTVDVTVNTPYGVSPTGPADRFTYSAAAPSVTGLSPASGLTTGGASVVVTGSNFTGATQVWFGSVLGTGLVVNSATQLTVTAPAEPAGTVDLVVTTPSGSSAITSADQFTFNPPVPAVTGVSPNTGSTAGGNVVTISGTGFAGATAVQFGGAQALMFKVNSDTSITAVDPAQGVGPVDVTVTTEAGTSAVVAGDTFTYTAAANLPTVTGLSPASGPTGGGTLVTISGTNLSGITQVLFGTLPANSVIVSSANSITAVAPAQSAGVVDVTVSTYAGTSSTSAADKFTYQAIAPTVTGVNPTSDTTAGGNWVTITGANFTVATAVNFGTTASPSFSVLSDTSILALEPVSAAGVFDVIVTTPSGTSALSPADQFTFTATAQIPTVTALSPGSGPSGGGTPVVITGTNFTNVTGVFFGGVASPSFSVQSATSISAASPALAAGSVHVTVAAGAGISSSSPADLFTSVATAPAVTALTPGSGPMSGGTVVTITGSNFNGATAVAFGANAATAFTVVSSTQITATAPAGAAGTADVQVTTPYGTSSVTPADQFTNVAAPTVTGLNVTSGSTAGSTTVDITGTNFTGMLSVAFGNLPAASITVNSSTQLTVTTPAEGPGPIDVTVTTANGTSQTSAADQFTFVAPVPAVTAVNPRVGDPAGGTTVTITGSGFTGATQVYFGSVTAPSYTIVSDTSIQATSPAQAAGTVDVAVVSSYGISSAAGPADLFTYASTPSVSNVNPVAGPTAGGTAVTLTGTNFTGVTSVSFGTTAAPSFTVLSATQISATTPAHAAATVDVTVSNGLVTSSTGPGDLFIYVAPPTVTGVNPSSGPIGGMTSVVITGSNFSAVGPTGLQVNFGTTPAGSITINSSTQITATAPAHAAGTVDITVTTAGGTSSTSAADQYTYIGPPTVTAVNPVHGPSAGGISVVITGTKFANVTAVTFGSLAATSYVVNSSTQITAVAPAESPATVDIKVTTASGMSSTSSADQFTFLTSPVRTNTGFQMNSLPATDDGSTGLVNLGFVANFFGTNYTQVYVNNNGNLTFDAPLSTKTPFNLTTTTHPIIAPFFADVDTRNGAVVHYGIDTVNGHPAFGVTWNTVGYYNLHTDKVNTFQVVLISRPDVAAGAFDVEFNYGSIRWETGDASGGSGGLGGASARAGLSNGSRVNGTNIELSGSGVNGAFLDANFGTGLIYGDRNTTVLGRYIFTVRTGGGPLVSGGGGQAAPDATGFAPAQVRSAYGFNTLGAGLASPPDGTGQTIAIVGAYDNPAIAQAVDTFDGQFALTPSGQTLLAQYGPAASFLTVLNQQGQPGPLPTTDPSGPGNANWELETALDVEWAHAIAPGAQIVLVEADSQSLSDLMAAVATAADLPGVSVVSMSWGFVEGQSVLAADEAQYDQVLTTPAGHPGVTFVASTGDFGAAVPEYPAFSPNVVAVGGTSLYLNADNSYAGETGWGAVDSGLGMAIGGGGGLSLYEAAPAYQAAVQATGYRTTPDVSLVADPNTGAWVADPYNLPAGTPWEVVGGTSLAAPGWAGLFAVVNEERAAAGSGPLGSAADPTATQEALYSVPYSNYHDITTGNNGYSAGPGYDLVTGLGTPAADRLVPDLAAYAGQASYTTPSGQVLLTASNLPSVGWSAPAVLTSPSNVMALDMPLTPGRAPAGPVVTADVGRLAPSVGAAMVDVSAPAAGAVSPAAPADRRGSGNAGDAAVVLEAAFAADPDGTPQAASGSAQLLPVLSAGTAIQQGTDLARLWSPEPLLTFDELPMGVAAVSTPALDAVFDMGADSDSWNLA
jgi:hypothetical protein